MQSVLTYDETLATRLPLPLAQLLRRARNAKTPLDRHQSAYFLWEASLKLLGAVAVAAYAERPGPDPKLTGLLENLARPSLGHWWEIVRGLLPVLAEGDPGFTAARDFLLGRARDDLPRAAGLDATLAELLEGGSGPRARVRPRELYDRLVAYRNKVIGHGAVGQHPTAYYQRLGTTLLAGVAELLDRFDVLAGRRLVYVADVRRSPAGGWLVERYDLTGESATLLAPLPLPESPAGRLPRPDRVHLAQEADEAALTQTDLHPLVVFDPEIGEALFLNARRGRQRVEYLSYRSGEVLDRPGLVGEQSELLARVLDLPVSDEKVEQWSARSEAEEGPTPEGPAARRALGDFELLGKLGHGGMGVVYRARQGQVGRVVALKCLLRSGDPRAEARFAREIRALGRVDHPNVVKIFTSGAVDDQWFYAMELVEGASLGAVCDEFQARKSTAADMNLATWHEALRTVCGDAPAVPVAAAEGPASPAAPALPAADSREYVSRAVEVVRQVAEGLHALHEAGVVHRDVKPGNVMVNPETGEAVLVDLGLAQLADELDGKLTRTRQFVGTLRYASPEQVLAVGGLDRRSDVYSLGVTLWELLTLRPMYGATEKTPTPLLMRWIEFRDPEPPHHYHPGLSPALEAVVMKCLEKDPDRRYATAKEVADDLARWQAGAPVSVRPWGWRGRLGRAVRGRARAVGRPLLLTAGLLAVVAVAIAVAVSKRGGDDTPTANAAGPNPASPAEVKPLGAPAGSAKETATAPPAGRGGTGAGTPSQPKETTVLVPEPQPVPDRKPQRVESLREGLKEIAGELKKALEARGETSINIGEFRGPPGAPEGGEPGLAHRLEEELTALGVKPDHQARLVVSASYRVDSEASEEAPVIRLTVRAEDDVGREVWGLPLQTPLSVTEAAQLFGLTVNLPLRTRGPDADKARAILKSLDTPTCFLRGTQLSADQGSPYSIEVLRTTRPEDRAAVPVTIEKGRPYAVVGKETYAIRLINDSDSEAAVALTVDGHPWCAFAEDEWLRKQRFMTIPAKKSAIILGWTKSIGQVTPFQLTPYRSAAAATLTPRASQAVTAVFAAAWEKGQPPPEDEPPGERGPDGTGAGATMTQNFGHGVRMIGAPRAAVTVRVTTGH
jgi:serine/threonine protein kinase